MAIFAKGADPEALDAIARTLTEVGRSLEAVRREAGTAVQGLRGEWSGGDLAALVGAWPRTDRAIASAAARVGALGRTLTTQAAEQRRTSEGTPGPVGPRMPRESYPTQPTLPGPTLPGPTLPGPTLPAPAGPPWSDTLRGTGRQPLDTDLAYVSDATYGDGDPTTGDFTRVSDDDLRALGLDPGQFSSSSGLLAHLYRDPDGHYVLAYAGTDPTSGADILTDAGQSLPGLSAQPGQYTQAVDLAVSVQDALDAHGHEGQLALTGHSLGGGLAAVASLATGATAVTFNAAGPSNDAIAYALGRRGGGNGLTTPAEVASTGQIRAYHTYLDPVTEVQQASADIPDALGHEIRLGTGVDLDWRKPWEVAYSDHDISSVERVMEGHGHDVPSYLPNPVTLLTNPADAIPGVANLHLPTGLPFPLIGPGITGQGSLLGQIPGPVGDVLSAVPDPTHPLSAVNTIGHDLGGVWDAIH